MLGQQSRTAGTGREPGRLSGRTLGQALLAAKAAAQDRDVRKSWVLLGDPSMPFDPDARMTAVEAGVGSGAASDDSAIETTAEGAGCTCHIGSTRRGAPAAMVVLILLGLLAAGRRTRS